jgi:hypothetical protein
VSFAVSQDVELEAQLSEVDAALMQFIEEFEDTMLALRND